MYLSDTSIKRPVFATMVITALVVLGIVSYFQMNVDLFPDVEFPFVVVTTIYPGAAPEAVSTDITQKIEDAVNPIAGVEHITSTSFEGVSQVFVEFSLETKAPEAAQEVREKVAAVRGDLPRDIETPLIQRFDPESEPVISLVMSGDRSQRELTTIADKTVKRQLESIEGVGAVEIVGGSERQFQVLLDLDAMNSRMITFQEVSSAIASSNFELPAGRLDRPGSEVLVRTMGRFSSLDDIKNVVVKNSNGQVIRLSDIAGISDGVKDRRSISRYNGVEAVTLQISRQSGANTVEVSDAVKERLGEVRNQLPPGVGVEVAQDNSIWIEDSLLDVQMTILYGGALAILCIFLFLANIPATIISAIAIPTSIISTFIFMRALGFTLNIMSLLGLSLAVGLLIDDAIVVIENIYRHMAQGESAIEAARHGTSEIGLAVMATTFSIVVVFVPVAFMSGIVGRFFYQFGLTVAVAVLVSLFIAFTLTPMMASRFLRPEEHLTKNTRNPLKLVLYYWNHAFQLLGDLYRSTLTWVLRHRAITLTGAILGFGVSMWLSTFLGFEFLPQQDQSQFYISFEAAAGSSLQQTSDLAERIEKIIASHEDVLKYQLLTIGGELTPVNEGTIYVKMRDRKERDISVFDFTPILRKELGDVPGITTSIQIEKSEGGGSKPVEYSIRGQDYSRLVQIAGQLETIVKQAPGAVEVENSEKQARPEYRINIDRELADDLGLNLAQIGGTVRSLVDGAEVSRFKEGDEEYEINVQLAPEYRVDEENLNSIYIPSSKKVNGENIVVPLRQVASIQQSTAPTEIKRFDRQREIRVGANLGAGYVMSDILQYVEGRQAELEIPPGYSFKAVGEAEIQEESNQNILGALFLAIIFIYILLASQFESFADPFSMGMSLLMAPVGAIIALLLFGTPNSIMSMIGIVLLMGLVTKNAILLIDFIKQARARGMDRTEAILQAGPIRLRPIMMTTLAMIFAMLPLAFAIGPGAELRAPMAQAVIGGLTSSTLLTLIIVPIVYTLLDDLVAFVTGRKKKAAKAAKYSLAAGTDNPSPAVDD
jgi:HAE1 family hydrophobic/amphiphilic exporter-1